MTNQIAVLVAEDEFIIRLSMQSALEEGGYAVLTALNGADAMRFLEAPDQDIVGLVTDIRMGNGPDGWELAEHARELNSEIAVVYVTADCADEWPVKGVPKSVMLQKPFADAQLVTAFSNLLNEAR